MVWQWVNWFVNKDYWQVNRTGEGYLWCVLPTRLNHQHLIRQLVWRVDTIALTHNPTSATQVTQSRRLASQTQPTWGVWGPLSIIQIFSEWFVDLNQYLEFPLCKMYRRPNPPVPIIMKRQMMGICKTKLVSVTHSGPDSDTRSWFKKSLSSCDVIVAK